MLGILALAFLASPPAPKLDELKRSLDPICDRFHGRLGYTVLIPDSAQRISFRGDERFPTASTIKTAIALAGILDVEEGKRKWTDKREVPPLSQRQSSMWSYHFKDGLKVDLDGWTNLMITVSDNTATMVLREWLGLYEINRRMEKLGLPNTKVLGTFPASDALNNRLRGQFGLGMTTPNEMAKLWSLIYSRRAASEAGCEKLLRILSHQYWDDFMGSAVPVGVTICSKSGAINRSRSETALVYAPIPFIVTIYTDSQKDQNWTSQNEGEVAIRKMCSLIWNKLNPHRPFKLPAGYEKFWPTGGGVEDSL